MASFPALTGNPVFYRTYSRRTPQDTRESWGEAAKRAARGVIKTGRISSQEDIELIEQLAERVVSLPSGRWLWVGGTPWIEVLENASGAFNCTSTAVIDWRSFALMMDLAMMGCGTGAVIEQRYIEKLPKIMNSVNVTVVGTPGEVPEVQRQVETVLHAEKSNKARMVVGDSRQGWVRSYELLPHLACSNSDGTPIDLVVDISHVRPMGVRLKGFGGVANPVKLPDLYLRVAAILNKAVGRKLTSVECSLLVDEAAAVVVAGNLRRSAGIRQGSSEDEEFAAAKDNLWQQDEQGNWRIDPERDALRMANHSRVFHHKPTEEECIAAVHRQFYSGEGAIQWAGEAVARANADLIYDADQKWAFISSYEKGSEAAKEWFKAQCPSITPEELDHRVERYGLNPCLAGETVILYQAKDSDEVLTSRVDVLAANQSVVKVKDGNGDWTETRFCQTSPSEELWEVRFKIVFPSRGDDLQNPGTSTVRTTGNHRFFLANGRVPVEVQHLQEGDLLVPASRLRGGYCQVISASRLGVSEPVYCCSVPTTGSFDLLLLHSHNCGEIIGKDYHCNLAEVHLNRIDPLDFKLQHDAFRVGGLNVAALLNLKFKEERYQFSREIDPIVGVSFTGLFDFFVSLFGVDWLKWWEAGRPDWRTMKKGNVSEDVKSALRYFNLEIEQFEVTDWDGDEDEISTGVIQIADVYREMEAQYLTRWRAWVEKTIKEYCDHHGLRQPNRCTTVQPSGTKALLTGASPGWHPPKAARFIRRITFAKNDPVALACIDEGYSVIPSQSDKDETGRLLDDPFDPRCTEWLVEIPVAVNWADLPGADTIHIEKFSALAQFDFYMQVQRYYVTHNCSATIELRENEIGDLGRRIYQAIQNNEGYISTALLARFDSLETFPRLPFEPVSREVYEQLVKEVESRRKPGTFHEHLARHDAASSELFQASEQGPAGCDSDKCLMPEKTPQ